ncbi:hypothetical protein [Microbispora amethystogenes]|uniref:hypothetical protein n=1 Tax=Microbispora amethystogenes TaxID=1427754 RepID=UPI0019548686|nr:hypothetical protein [Microbispora amethystogenes]
MKRSARAKRAGACAGATRTARVERAVACAGAGRVARRGSRKRLIHLIRRTPGDGGDRPGPVP